MNGKTFSLSFKFPKCRVHRACRISTVDYFVSYCTFYCAVHELSATYNSFYRLSSNLSIIEGLLVVSSS
jgi:hypothetical protein